MKKIILDVYGADNSPDAIIEGAVNAINKDAALTVVLCGKKSEMEECLKRHQYNVSQIEIIDSSEVISNNDSPTEAIKRKKDSSMVRAFDALKADSEICALVTAGSTGAALAGSIFKVGRIKTAPRPALAPILPTLGGGKVLLIDSGANVDSKPHFLAGFAVMGSAFMRGCGVQSPRVALLSNGAEDKKGNELTQAAFALIKELPGINFVGNVEARDVLSGDYDVIVCDGFAGNVLLKSTEGAVKLILTQLKESISGSFSAKIGYLFMKKAFRGLKNKLDYNKFGGAPFLGVKKLVIKSHGSSKADAIEASLLQAKSLSDANIVNCIETALQEAGFGGAEEN